ncbi:chemotaxis protein CheW [Phenylobacterium sp. J426]|uniref:chemotaxis protein CheW n=1 Tax=Phenylobacterium sp. J426 TaxID=2898439 RepID=UPI0021511C97|nr:chemotaxis protein CheW [Phenylobacterium sp. J426]MCR5873855.1 chemotaxis protein CheW [Phenylobacterium sp. J426]
MNDISNTAGGQELISFRIGAQEFCVDIMDVREIRGWTPATAIPDSPAFVRGVINLRGAVLPIMDLGARLGLGAADPTARHVIIVAQVQNQVVGLLVDAVSDILTITEDQIQPTPDVGSDFARSSVRGLLAIDGRMVSFLSLGGLFPQDDLEVAA